MCRDPVRRWYMLTIEQRPSNGLRREIGNMYVESYPGLFQNAANNSGIDYLICSKNGNRYIVASPYLTDCYCGSLNKGYSKLTWINFTFSISYTPIPFCINISNTIDVWKACPVVFEFFPLTRHVLQKAIETIPVDNGIGLYSLRYIAYTCQTIPFGYLFHNAEKYLPLVSSDRATLSSLLESSSVPLWPDSPTVYLFNIIYR